MRGSKKGSTRSSDGRAIDADEQRSKWSGNENCGGARWRADRINPTGPPSNSLLYLTEP
jgi:hypothetical protein